MLRVLIVDDSPTMRRLLRRILSNEGDITIVGEAADAFEARQLIFELRPDALTLDLSMPKIDGVSFLATLRKHYPMPVVVVSSLASDHRVLEGNDVLVIDKKDAGRAGMLGAALRKVAGRSKKAAKKAAVMIDLILIGASTGGPAAVERVLAGFRADDPPIVIAQHMPHDFTAAFSKRLNEAVNISVCEAQHRMVLERGTAIIAPGGRQTRIVKRGEKYSVNVTQEARVNLHAPSIQVLFESGLPNAKNISAGLLTGMGSDGSSALASLRKHGAHTVAQDEATSVVYGMARRAAELNGVVEELPLGRIAEALRRGGGE
ncbi:MAG: chemotaxis protein CheB [Myxococcota bacterium]